MIRTLILGILLCVSVAAQEGQRYKGIYLFQEGKYAEAAEALRNVPETEKELSETWVYLVFSYFKLDNELAAREALATYQNIKITSPVRPTKSYDTAPKIKSTPRATYTDEAKRARVEGSVLLWVELQADGKIGSIFVKKSLPNGLSESALKAAQQIRFEPAIRNGKPVTVVFVFSYDFMPL